MQAAALITDLATRGITLIAEGSDLMVESDGEITEPDRAVIRAHKEELSALKPAERPVTPAESLVGTCARLGIALRVEPDGTLVVGTRGQEIPASLARALEVHCEAVAQLVLGPEQEPKAGKR